MAAARERIQELEQQVTELQQQAQALEREPETVGRPNIAELMWEFEKALLGELRLGKQAKKAKDIRSLIKRFIQRHQQAP